MHVQLAQAAAPRHRREQLRGPLVAETENLTEVHLLKLCHLRLRQCAQACTGLSLSLSLYSLLTIAELVA